MKGTGSITVSNAELLSIIDVGKALDITFGDDYKATRIEHVGDVNGNAVWRIDFKGTEPAQDAKV